jgi:PAS domain S-box-containing protein
MPPKNDSNQASMLAAAAAGSDPAILDALSDPVMVIGPDRRIAYANPAFCSMYDVDQEAVRGLDCRDLVDGEVCTPGQCLLEISLTGTGEESQSVHNVFCRKQEIGPLCITCSLVHDEQGRVAGAVELHKDMAILGEYITAVEQARESVEREKGNQETILAGIADGVFTVDRDLTVTGANAKCLELLGKREEDVVGRQCTDVFRSNICDSDCPIRWALEHRKNVIDCRERILGDGDRAVEVLKSVFLLSDPEADDARVVGIMRDVSEYNELKRAAAQRHKFFGLVSRSPRMQEVFRLVDTISTSDTSVLITGESGTGKELIATAIQESSLRRKKPFLKINCSALTETLLESELFGHEKGAFTGAVAEKPGKFEVADGGTVFLDEVGDMSLGLQAKLLRLLQEREFQRVGGHRTIKVDVRLIAATNKDLKAEIEAGRFREDIYYRLCVIPIRLEPLRERPEDIPLLIHHFMDVFRQKYRRPIRELSERALHMLTRYPWPGNVRELQNVIEYAFVCCNGPRLMREHLPVEIRSSVPGGGLPETVSPDEEGTEQGTLKQRILQLLQTHGGNRGEVARVLGISRTTLWRRMKDLGIGG